MNLCPKDYEKKKKQLIEFKMNFKEVTTSSRKYLQVSSNRYYVSPKTERRMDLRYKELGLINQCSNAVIKSLEKRLEPFALCEGLPNYCMYNMGTSWSEGKDSFSSLDIWEVDIKAAYLTACLNRKLISHKVYDKFFTLEQNKKELERKNPSDCTATNNKGANCVKCKSGVHLIPKHSKRYYCKDTGNILAYSKDCRLIALGKLAQRKTVNEYSAEIRTQLHYKKGRVYQSAQGRTKSELVRSYNEYNEQHANAFYLCALDVDRIMIDIMKNVQGVYWVWSDAIFCTEDAVSAVQAHLKMGQFASRAMRHEYFEYNGRRRDVHLKKTGKKELCPYKFSGAKHLSNIVILEDTACDFKRALDSYQNGLSYCDKIGPDKEVEIIAKNLEISSKQLKYRLKVTGYNRALDYALFYEAKRILGIKSLDQFNTQYMSKMLNSRGLCAGDFMKVQRMTKKTFKYKDCTLKFASDSAIFFEAYDKKMGNKMEKLASSEGADKIGDYDKETYLFSKFAELETRGVDDFIEQF